jgi:prepilin-type processing-associated H-X9-DG protein
VLGWRKLLVVLSVDVALFFLSDATAASSRHSGTLSNVLWVDFLIGVLSLIVLALCAVVRSTFARGR